MLDPSGPVRTRIRGAGRATTLAVVTAALVSGAGLPVLATASAESVAPKRIGSAPVAPRDAVKAAAPDADTQLDLGITLEPRDQAALTTFVTGVSTPGSPLYKHYLGTGEFGKRFGADPATVASVRAALTAAGLHPGEVGANGLTIPVKATVAEAEKAFDTDFAGYTLADGTPALANTKAPAIRGDLAGRIASVSGLNTTVKAVSRAVPKEKAKPKSDAASTGTPMSARNIGANRQMCSVWSNKLANDYTYAFLEGRDYYSPASLATAYDMNDMPDGGSGATVAILSLENYDSAAVSRWQGCTGTKANVSNVRAYGTDAAPKLYDAQGYPNEGWETALDIEMVAGMAPGSNILVYQGNTTEAGVLATYQRIVNENRASVVSISWGRCEASTSDSAINLVLQQAAAQGQSVVAASGDSGASGCYNSNGSLATVTDNPASLPYATGVGGTSHTGISQFPYQSVWNRYGGASGGGVSKWWRLDDTVNPAGSLHAPGYNGQVCNAGAGQSCRQVPDVAALADPNTGYFVIGGRDDEDWNIWGGTSAAAPLWAAIVATANVSTQCAANGPVGFLNPALYKLAGNSAVFGDVTAGNNALTGYDNNGNVVGYGSGYNATSGYDLATGLGSPKGRGLIAALCHQLPSQPAGTYTSLQPKRLLDTRTPGIASRTATTLKIAGDGVSGVPANASTVVLNVTAANSNGPGFLTAWPTGTPMPVSSNLNWMQGSVAVPNLVTVPVGTDGKVSLFNGSWTGSIRMVVDVFGYYTPDTAGAKFKPLTPTRVFDTRYAGDANVAQGQIGGKKQIDVKIAGGVSAKGAPLGVPATGVTAVVLNTTVTRGKGNGWMTVFPTGVSPVPTASNLNWTDAQTVPNLVIVPIGADGKVSFYNAMDGTVDVLADVFGYFTADGSGATFHSAGPARLVDTRWGKGVPAAGQINDGTVLRVNLNDDGVLAGATSVVLNVTVTGTHWSGVLNAWADGTARPSSSNLNWTAGSQTIANSVIVPIQNGWVDIESNSPTDVIVDVMGYYSAS
ncbi:protease pro-enzyme activation domain-containing protein [Kitasatospora sp. NBC_01539]|uniref:S53 family peptidase n=1 Tax=Kitasatospora sp. NBC_01539 TaxID=2903577 RepID=UPI0038601B0C